MRVLLSLLTGIRCEWLSIETQSVAHSNRRRGEPWFTVIGGALQR